MECSLFVLIVYNDVPLCRSFIVYHCIYLLGVGLFNLEAYALQFWEISICLSFVCLFVCSSFIVFPFEILLVFLSGNTFIWPLDLLLSTSNFIFFSFVFYLILFASYSVRVPQLCYLFCLLHFQFPISEF